MESNITINIVEPGSTPVVPDTGLFMSGIGGPEATILGIMAVVILAAVIAIIYYRKKKQGTVTGLLAKCKQILKAKKPVAVGLSALALLVSIGTVAGLLKLGASAVDLEEAETEDTTASVDNADVVIELGDEPVFALVPVKVTVTEEMPAGYTLKAYSENPTLSSEGTDKTIDLVTIPEDNLDNAGSLTTSLTDNTWGLAIEEPESEEQEIYFSLPETKEEAMVIKSIDDYSATEAGDTTTVYYGVYITPDMPYGTYTGATVSYVVEENKLTTVTFDGNGLYFNDDAQQTTNIVKYIAGSRGETVYSYTPNLDDTGAQVSNLQFNTIVNEVKTVEGAENLHIVLKYGTYDNTWDYVTFWQGSHPEYTAKDDYDKGIKECGGVSSDGRFAGNYSNPVTMACDIPGDTVTFGFWSQPAGGPPLGYGYYATVTGYTPNNEVSGEYKLPSSTVAYEFLGWSTDVSATTPMYYSGDSAYIDLTGGDITLYAVWQPIFEISYKGNGADNTTSMNDVKQYTTDLEPTSKSVDLLASNFSREGYGFVGWSTDENAWDHLVDNDDSNDPTIYGPNQTIIIDEDLIAEVGDNKKLILNAVWAPAEVDGGNPVYLQDWQGCSELTPTTYSNGVLTVGKNTITALTDARDGSVYTVARLADGNCWMTENLRLDNEPELTAENTNNPSLPLTNDDTNHTTSNYLSASSNDWCSFTWSDSEQDALCANQSKLNTNNTALASTSPAFSQDFTIGAHKNLDANIVSYGNYYNWYSATAGNGKQETDSNITVAGDICPTGWQLPYGGDQDESEEGYNKGNTNGGFYYLNQKMGGEQYSSQASNNWRSFPNNFVYSGYWSGSSAGGRGGYGNYWSSTANDTYSAFYLYLYSSYVDLGTNNSYKYSGYSARCLAPGE